MNGVREKRWRILVGEDAKLLDKFVRADPEAAYEVRFFEDFAGKFAEKYEAVSKKNV